jgi:predicted RNA polymerase sigma factor
LSISPFYARDIVLTAFELFPSILQALEVHYKHLSHDVILQRMCLAMTAVLFPELPYEIPDASERQNRIQAVIHDHLLDLIGHFIYYMDGEQEDNTASKALHQFMVEICLQKLDEFDAL